MNSTQFLGLGLGTLLVGFATWQIGVLRRRNQTLVAKRERIAPELFAFLRRQTARRIQTTILFGLAGGMMIAGIVISAQEHPQLFLFLWLGVLLMLIWVMALALFDFIAVRLHYRIEHQQNEAEKIGLEYVLRNLRAHVESIEPGASTNEIDPKKTTKQPDE